LKPGEAQVIHLLPIPADKLDPSLRASQHISIDFLIIDTRTGSSGQKVFVETVLGVNIVHGEGTAPGRYDKTTYADLYGGEKVE
jgi:hypothetical protein